MQTSSDALNIAQLIAGLHVLAVEDVDDSREMLVAVLEIYGARVTAVATALEALDVLACEQPDVLVSDIHMPDATGYDLIGWIRERPKEQGGELPAIALTAFAAEQDRRAILAAGFQAYIAKPFEPNDLVTMIKAITSAH